jgi:hypothetical protein
MHESDAKMVEGAHETFALRNFTTKIHAVRRLLYYIGDDSNWKVEPSNNNLFRLFVPGRCR